MTMCYHVAEKMAFVHIPKCAGTAIGGRIGDDQVWKDCWLEKALPGWTRDRLKNNGHHPVFALEYITGYPLDFWTKILVPIRNPFEQQVSQFSFWRDRAKRLHGSHIPHADDKFAASVTFEQFVQDPRSNGPNAYCGDRWKATGGVYAWWTHDATGSLPESVRIIRVEDLPISLHEALGCGSGVELPWTNSMSDKYAPWMDFYNEESAAAVRQKFSWSLARYYPDLTNFQGSGTMTARERGAESLMFA